MVNSIKSQHDPSPPTDLYDGKAGFVAGVIQEDPRPDHSWGCIGHGAIHEGVMGSLAIILIKSVGWTTKSERPWFVM